MRKPKDTRKPPRPKPARNPQSRQTPSSGDAERQPAAVFSPGFSAEWMPLNEAFARAKAALGSHDLAAQDLWTRLRSGQLPSAVWRVRRDREDRFERLEPLSWDGRRLLEGGEPKRVCVMDSGANLLDGYVSGDFFVARRVIDRLHVVGSAEDEPPPPGRPRGPKPIRNWKLVVARELIRRLKAGEEEPTIEEMIERCATTVRYSPGAKEMGELLNQLIPGRF